MKNIYDIIAEQKAIVDVNIATYDLEYTIECFNSYGNEYIQEGLGESIKNIAQKVIEFIKNIINKIKELVRKMINWMTGKKDVVKKLDEEIQAANGGSGDGENKASSDEHNDNLKNTKDRVEKMRDKIKKDREELEKQIKANEAEAARKKRAREREEREKRDQRRDNIKKAYKKCDNIYEVLKNCKARVKIPTFASLDDNVNLAKKFFNNVSKVAQELISKNIIDDNILIREVIDKTFRGAGSFDNNGGKAMDISKRIAKELYEENAGEHENYISLYADKVYSYLSKGNEAIKYIQGQEKVAVDNLNKLLRYVEQASTGNQLSNNDDNINKRINLIRSTSSIIGEFVNAICQSIVKSMNISQQLAIKAKNLYIEQVKNM